MLGVISSEAENSSDSSNKTSVLVHKYVDTWTPFDDTIQTQDDDISSSADQGFSRPVFQPTSVSAGYLASLAVLQVALGTGELCC